MSEPRKDASIRDEAVRIVDQRHGYTVEQSSSPEQHRQEYDDEEARLKDAQIRPGYLRYSVSFSKRDWPLRPWRWKRVRETRYMKIGGAS